MAYEAFENFALHSECHYLGSRCILCYAPLTRGCLVRYQLLSFRTLEEEIYKLFPKMNSELFQKMWPEDEAGGKIYLQTLHCGKPQLLGDE